MAERFIVNTSNSWRSGAQASPIALFRQTRNFTSLCLSSLICINGHRRHTAGGPCDGLASCPLGSSNTPGMLHAKETGISSDRLGLWLMCAFIAFTLVLRRPLLRCTVVRCGYCNCSMSFQSFLSCYLVIAPVRITKKLKSSTHSR